jgi:predicted amidohydrolase
MSRDSITVAIAQFAPGSSWSANAEQILGFAREAHACGAELLVCPEYSHSFVAQQGPAWAEMAQPLDGEFVAALMEASVAAGGIVIIAGMLVRGSGKPTNTMVAVGPTGILASASKLHLYDAFGAQESEWVHAGEIAPPEILVIGDHRIGLMACYDLRFPEVARRLVDAGANCLVVPAQWVPGPDKVLHWTTLLHARAIENQAFVLAADHPSPHGVGNSMVIDPLGATLLVIPEGTELGFATLDAGLVETVRENNPALQARRFEVTEKA